MILFFSISVTPISISLHLHPGTKLFYCRCGRKYFFRCSRASAYFPFLPVKADHKAGKRTGYPAVRQKRPQCPPDRSRTLILRGGTPACTAISCQIFPLTEDALMAVVPVSHKYADAASVSLPALSDEDFILMNPYTSCDAACHRSLSEK